MDLEKNAAEMRKEILGKKLVAHNNSALKVVDVYVKENTTGLIYPF